MVVQVFGYGADQRRRDQRFVALHIDHDCRIRPALLLDDFRDAVGAAGVALFGQACLEAMLVHHVGNSVVVGRDPDLLRTALRGLFGNPDHHRLAGDRQQRFAGQSCGRVARRNHDVKVGH